MTNKDLLAKANGLVIYEGPSKIDGAPIVVGENDMFKQFSDNQLSRFASAQARADMYQLDIVAHPIAGMENKYLKTLEEQVDRLEEFADWARKHYGFRGFSKSLIATVHAETNNTDTFDFLSPA